MLTIKAYLGGKGVAWAILEDPGSNLVIGTLIYCKQLKRRNVGMTKEAGNGPFKWPRKIAFTFLNSNNLFVRTRNASDLQQRLLPHPRPRNRPPSSSQLSNFPRSSRWSRKRTRQPLRRLSSARKKSPTRCWTTTMIGRTGTNTIKSFLP